MDKYELVKFKQNDLEIDVNVSPEEDTIWLSKEQMADLYGRDRSVISRHISNIYSEDEIDKESSCAKIAQEIGGQTHYITIYNLDIVISVGYRVKSKNGTIFRKWANKILKDYLIKGYTIDEDRTLITNENYINLINKVDSIDKRLSKIEKNEIDIEKIFFDGEMFDARSFITNIISKAKETIILIDGYADIKALDFLKNKKDEVKIIIYHSSKAKLSIRDINAFNKQYGNCETKIKNNFHDRFLIIDNNELYHLGASLNYAGKKVFAINKIEDKEILKLIINNL